MKYDHIQALIDSLPNGSSQRWLAIQVALLAEPDDLECSLIEQADSYLRGSIPFQTLKARRIQLSGLSQSALISSLIDGSASASSYLAAMATIYDHPRSAAIDSIWYTMYWARLMDEKLGAPLVRFAPLYQHSIHTLTHIISEIGSLQGHRSLG